MPNGSFNFSFTIDSANGGITNAERAKSFNNVLLPSGVYMRLRPSKGFLEHFNLQSCCFASSRALCTGSYDQNPGKRKTNREEAMRRLMSKQQ